MYTAVAVVNDLSLIALSGESSSIATKVETTEVSFERVERGPP